MTTTENIENRRRALRNRIILLIGIAFFVSLALFLLFPKSLERTVLYFIEKRSNLEVTETRFLPFAADNQEKANLILRALFAGPQDLTFSRYAINSADFISATMIENQLIVELGTKFQDFDERCTASPKQRVKLLRKNLEFNLPQISKITIRIGGISANL